MKLCTITIECVFGIYLEESVSKVCELETSYALYDLYYFIIKCFGFDDDHMHEFFLSRRCFRSKKEIIEDESFMLEDIFPLKKNTSLFMLFDYGDNWVFKIKRSRKKTEPNKNITYPRVLEAFGENPEQYPSYE
jgi:hypothetical protein